MKKIPIILIALLFSSFFPYARASMLISFKDISLNVDGKKFVLKHRENTYFFPSSDPDNYIGIKKILSGDVDGDNKKEYLVGVQLLCNPNDKFSPTYGCVLIFKQNKNETKLVEGFVVGDGFTDLELFDVNKDGVLDLIAKGISGAHWAELKIISYQKGKYLTLWDTGSPSGVFFLVDKNGNVQIKIGIPRDEAGWSYADEPAWEIWTWDGKRFVYSSGETNVSQIGELHLSGSR